MNRGSRETVTTRHYWPQLIKVWYARGNTYNKAGRKGNVDDVEVKLDSGHLSVTTIPREDMRIATLSVRGRFDVGSVDREGYFIPIKNFTLQDMNIAFSSPLGKYEATGWSSRTAIGTGSITGAYEEVVTDGGLLTMYTGSGEQYVEDELVGSIKLVCPLLKAKVQEDITALTFTFSASGSFAVRNY